jgi:hypothetical protein
VREWRSKALPRYQRLTKRAEALIAAVYVAGTNLRRVRRALFSLFEGVVSKDVVSRVWRKVKVDRDAWRARSLADEDIVRLILDGTVIKTRLERKATNISSLAAIGVRRDGQKVLLSIRNMGGQSTAAWRQFLDDPDARGPSRKLASGASPSPGSPRRHGYRREAPIPSRSSTRNSTAASRPSLCGPSAKPRPCCFRALLAFRPDPDAQGQGAKTLSQPIQPMPLDLAA